MEAEKRHAVIIKLGPCRLPVEGAAWHMDQLNRWNPSASDPDGDRKEMRVEYKIMAQTAVSKKNSLIIEIFHSGNPPSQMECFLNAMDLSHIYIDK